MTVCLPTSHLLAAQGISSVLVVPDQLVVLVCSGDWDVSVAAIGAIAEIF